MIQRNCDINIFFAYIENVVWLNLVERMYEYKEELIKDSTMTHTSLKLDRENDWIRKDYIKLMKSFDISLDIFIMPTKEPNKRWVN